MPGNRARQMNGRARMILPGRPPSRPAPHQQGSQGQGAEEHDNPDEQHEQQAFDDDADDAQDDRQQQEQGNHGSSAPPGRYRRARSRSPPLSSTRNIFRSRRVRQNWETSIPLSWRVRSLIVSDRSQDWAAKTGAFPFLPRFTKETDSVVR